MTQQELDDIHDRLVRRLKVVRSDRAVLPQGRSNFTLHLKVPGGWRITGITGLEGALRFLGVSESLAAGEIANDKHETFKWGPFDVKVANAGATTPTWSESSQVHFEYAVTVTRKGAPRPGSPGTSTYKTSAWGSRNDYDKGDDGKHEEMGAMVVSELASAGADPDEFIELVVGDARGKDALARGRVAEKVIKAAQRLGVDELIETANALRDEGLL